MSKLSHLEYSPALYDMGEDARKLALWCMIGSDLCIGFAVGFVGIALYFAW